MKDIGIVIYTKGNEPGTLDAKWFMSPEKGGTGRAIGGPTTGYVGKYKIKYYHEDGAFDAELDLIINKPGIAYEIFWEKDGVVRAKGTGMEVNGDLAVGWHSVNNS
jgi:hypothetical protein